MRSLPNVLGLEEIGERDPFLGSLLPWLAESDVGEIYLVGGYLRDYFLGEISRDIDFITKADPGLVASRVASRFEGKAFLLHEEEKAYRAIFPDHDHRITIDFSPIKGQSAEEDLSQRDFTINAMAVDVERLVEEKTLRLPRDLIDKHYGWRDLSRRILRECDNHTFLMDPVRLVRALRFRYTLGMEYEERTSNHMKKYAPLILKVPGERLQVELMEILLMPAASTMFAELESNPILQYLFPELAATVGVEQNAYHHLDVWSHSLLALDELDLLLSDPARAYPDYAEAIQTHMRQTLQDLWPRSAFLRLAVLYHDAGKVERYTRDRKGRIHFYGHEALSKRAAEDLAGRLCLSSKATDYLAGTIGKHMLILLGMKEEPTARDFAGIAGQLGEELVDIVLLSTADRFATRGPLTTPEEVRRYVEYCRRLLAEYYRAKEVSALLRGGDIIDQLGVSRGPLIGEILDEVRLAQLEGSVSTREEALEFARSLILTRKSPGLDY